MSNTRVFHRMLRQGLLAAALLLGGPAGQAADEPGVPAKGKSLYYAHGCYGCHGYNGETGVVRLVGTDSPIIGNFDVFVSFLRARADLAPLFPSTRMPSYPAASLSDADARDLYAYIRTFELDAPEVDDVPVLEAIRDSASKTPTD